MTNVIAALVATWMVAVDLVTVLVGRTEKPGKQGFEWSQSEGGSR